MATDNAPAPATPPPVRSAGETSTNVLSVRLPSAELRRALTAKCEQDDVSVREFITRVTEAYLDGRLRIVEKESPRPSFLIPADADPDR